MAELGRIINGAGGHIEQRCAYLEHYSAAAYLALCRQSAVVATLHARTPQSEAARHIVAAVGPLSMQVTALGAGEALAALAALLFARRPVPARHEGSAGGRSGPVEAQPVCDRRCSTPFTRRQPGQ